MLIKWSVFYDTAKGYAQHKDFDLPSKAYKFWRQKQKTKKGNPFISAHKNDDYSGYNFDPSWINLWGGLKTDEEMFDEFKKFVTKSIKWWE